MGSMNMAFGVAAAKGRVFVVKAAKSSGGGNGEEKGLLDWILGGLQKEDQLLETDSVLNKVEGKSSSAVGSGKTTTSSTISVPNKKKFGGFGGLFAKN